MASSGNCVPDTASAAGAQHFTRQYCADLVRRTLRLDAQDQHSQQLLRRNFDADLHVCDVQMRPRLNASGFLGDYYELIVTCELTGNGYDVSNPTAQHQLRYFVKTTPYGRPALLRMMHDLGILGKENLIYDRIFAVLNRFQPSPKWRPQCYDARNADFIVLEDLNFADENPTSYVHIPPVEPFDVVHVRSALQSLAQMHAAGLAYELRTGRSIGVEFAGLLSESFVRKDCEWFMTGFNAIPGICHLLPDFAAKYRQPCYRQRFHDHLNTVFDLVPSSVRHRNVLCHRDLWTRNLMFSSCDSPADHQPPPSSSSSPSSRRPMPHCVLLDFQLSRYQPPAIDIAQLLQLNTRRAHRRAHLEAHLRWYWRRLRAELTTVDGTVDVMRAVRLQWPLFRQSYDELQLFGLVLGCVSAPLSKLPDACMADFQRDPTRDRATFVRESMDRDEEYAHMVRECFADLVAHLEAIDGERTMAAGGQSEKVVK